MPPKSARTLPQHQREVNRDDKRYELRLASLEALAGWVRSDLYPWLIGLAASVGYAVTLRRPPS